MEAGETEPSLQIWFAKKLRLPGLAAAWPRISPILSWPALKTLSRDTSRTAPCVQSIANAAETGILYPHRRNISTPSAAPDAEADTVIFQPARLRPVRLGVLTFQRNLPSRSRLTADKNRVSACRISPIGRCCSLHLVE